MERLDRDARAMLLEVRLQRGVGCVVRVELLDAERVPERPEQLELQHVSETQEGEASAQSSQTGDFKDRQGSVQRHVSLTCLG